MNLTGFYNKFVYFQVTIFENKHGSLEMPPASACLGLCLGLLALSADATGVEIRQEVRAAVRAAVLGAAPVPPLRATHLPC